ncbi:hypothetical protein Tco_1252069 [Tanacetum coccineum]
MQQFWHTVSENEATKKCHFQLDNQCFEIGADLLRKVLQLFPKQHNQSFTEPPTHNSLIYFIEALGYDEDDETPLKQISQVIVTKLHQPWRTILSILNKCLAEKDSRTNSSIKSQAEERNQKSLRSYPIQGVRKTGEKGLMMRSEEVDEHVESCKTKIVLRENKKVAPVANEVKETYTRKNDSGDVEGQGEGSEIRKDTQDDMDFIDSDQTPSATRLDNIVNEGNVDDVSNYTVFVHYKQKEAKEKETHIFKPLSPPTTGSSHDDVSCYLNKNPTPSLRDVGLPRTTRTSGLNSHNRSSRKGKPCGDSIDLDRLPESQRLIVPKFTMTEPTGQNQHGSIVFNPEMHLTPRETPTLGLILGGNPELTSCISCASKIPLDDLVKLQIFREVNPMEKQFKALKGQVLEQKKRMNDFIAFTIQAAIEEPVSAHVITEVKNHALALVPDVDADFIRPRLHSTLRHVLCTEHISLTTTPRFSTTNITIPELKEELHDMDWVSQSGYINKDQELVDDYNEPLPLDGPRYGRRVPIEHFFNKYLQYLESGNKDMKGKKYALSITKRPATEYKIGWIEEDIGSLFRNTIVKYDEDVALEIHQKMQKLFYKGKRASVTKGNVYSDLRITFVKEVKVDHQFEFRLLDSITVTRADKLDYTFKESDFSYLNLNDIEHMYVLKVHGKLHHLEGTT